MSIKAKITLYDGVEYALFAEFEEKVNAHRAAERAKLPRHPFGGFGAVSRTMPKTSTPDVVQQLFDKMDGTATQPASALVPDGPTPNIRGHMDTSMPFLGEPLDEPPSREIPPSAQDAKDALHALVKRASLQACQALLQKFGVTKVSDIPEQNRAAWIEQANAVAA